VLNDGATDSDQVEGGPSEDVLVSGKTGDEFLLVSRGQVFAYYDRLLSRGTAFVPLLLCSCAFTFSSATGKGPFKDFALCCEAVYVPLA
jgi:hypothetical protein